MQFVAATEGKDPPSESEHGILNEFSDSDIDAADKIAPSVRGVGVSEVLFKNKFILFRIL